MSSKDNRNQKFSDTKNSRKSPTSEDSGLVIIRARATAYVIERGDFVEMKVQPIGGGRSITVARDDIVATQQPDGTFIDVRADRKRYADLRKGMKFQLTS